MFNCELKVAGHSKLYAPLWIRRTGHFLLFRCSMGSIKRPELKKSTTNYSNTDSNQFTGSRAPAAAKLKTTATIIASQQQLWKQQKWTEQEWILGWSQNNWPNQISSVCNNTSYRKATTTITTTPTTVRRNDACSARIVWYITLRSYWKRTSHFLSLLR